MASTTSRSWPSRRNSVGKLNCPSLEPARADLLQDIALHIEHPDLLAQGVRYVDPLGGGIHGDSRGPLEIPFTLDAADNSPKFPVGIEDRRFCPSTNR